MTTCLVLGATGFIGGQIVRAALVRGWRVRALRRDPHAVGAIGDLRPDWISGNLDDPASLRAAMRGCEVVFHAAAAYPHSAKNIDQHVQAAVAQLRTVLDAARDAQVKRVIYTSSFTTIGPARDRSRGADEQDCYEPGSAGDAYYEAKWAMEVAALKSDVPVIALCPSAVFGPGDVHLSVSEIIVQTAQGKMPVYVDATFGAIDVRDVAEAFARALDHPAPIGATINVGSGIATTICDVAHGLATALDVDPELVVTGQYRLGDIRHNCADLTALRSTLGFSPQTTVSEGLRQFVEWLKTEPVPADGLEQANRELISRKLMA